jgi:hypothetical protein
MSSILSQKTVNPPVAPDDEWMVFAEMTRTPTFFVMHGGSPVRTPWALLLLCGKSARVTPAIGMQAENGWVSFTLDEWICYEMPQQTASHIMVLRSRFQEAFLQFIRSPQQQLAKSAALLRVITQVLVTAAAPMDMSANMGGKQGGSGKGYNQQPRGKGKGRGSKGGKGRGY